MEDLKKMKTYKFALTMVLLLLITSFMVSASFSFEKLNQKEQEVDLKYLSVVSKKENLELALDQLIQRKEKLRQELVIATERKRLRDLQIKASRMIANRNQRLSSTASSKDTTPTAQTAQTNTITTTKPVVKTVKKRVPVVKRVKKKAPRTRAS